MSKIMLWALVITLSIAGVGATVAAESGALGSGQSWRNLPGGRLLQGQIGRLMSLRAELNLSDEQRSQIRQMPHSKKSQISKLLTQLVEQRSTLRDMAIQETPDKKTIQKTSDQMAKTVAQAAILGGELRQKIMTVMDDEQRLILAAVQSDRQDAMDKWLSELAQP